MNISEPSDTSEKSGLRSLVAGGIATLLASTCCLGPLVLITLGFSGAWIGKLAAFEPFQPLFIGTACVALFFAGKRIWRPVAQCAPDELCALPRVRRAYQILYVGVCALLLMALVFPMLAPWFY